MWCGTAAPWGKFLAKDVILLYRLIPLAVLVLIFWTLPQVYAIYKKIPWIQHARQAVFAGFFGLIRVSTIFYLCITRELLDILREDDGRLWPDCK